MDSRQETGAAPKTGIYKYKPAVANVGIMLFYQALVDQDCDCVQVSWVPEYEQSEEIAEMLDEFL